MHRQFALLNCECISFIGSALSIVNGLFIVCFAVLVLQGMQQTFSERLYWGLYSLVESLGVVRRLRLMVAEDETVPQSYELYRWSRFELSDLRLSGGKEALIFQTFASHRSSYTCAGGIPACCYCC